MNEVQACALDVLVAVDAFCKEHGIPYFLAWGTLLGAVRHQGFIPWDDDIDILMVREDYDRFCTLARTKLPPPYELICRESGKYAFPYAKVHNTQTTFIERTELSVPQKHKGIFIDIFPLDGAPSDQKERRRYEKRRSFYQRGMTAHAVLQSKLGKPTVLQRLSCLLPNAFYFRRHHKLLTRYAFHACEKTSWKQDRDIFSETADYVFEGKTFPSVKNYHQYLTREYGDYMTLPPEDSRYTHNNGAVISVTESYKSIKR